MIEQKLAARIRKVLEGKTQKVQLHVIIRVLRGILFTEGRKTKAKKKTQVNP